MLQTGAVLYLFLKISMAILENFFQGTQHIASQVSVMLKAEIKIEFLGQNSTPNPIKSQLFAAYLSARKLELFVSLAWCCCAPKGVAIPCQVGEQG